MPNLDRYGAGLLGDLSDIQVQDIERLRYNRWHVRGTVNFRFGAAAYASVLERLADAGVSVLPILFWMNERGEPVCPRHPEWDQARWEAQCFNFGLLLGDLNKRRPGLAPRQVEIWNEQNTIGLWRETANSAPGYTKHMLLPARSAIRRGAAADIAIVCGGLAFRHWVKDGVYRARAAEDYVRDLKNAGALPAIDRWSIHPYGRTRFDGQRVSDERISPELAKEEVRRFKIMLNKIDAVRPVWITETGLSTAHGFSEAQQSVFLREFWDKVQVVRGHYGVTAWSVWPLRNPPPGESDYYYSGLYRYDGSLTQQGEFLKGLAR